MVYNKKIVLKLLGTEKLIYLKEEQPLLLQFQEAVGFLLF